MSDGGSEEVSESQLCSFGIGCFHFGLRSSTGVEEFRIDEYTEQVRSFLSRYPNIESISIAQLRFTKFWDENLDNSSPWLDELDEIVPWPTSWAVEFTINIPERVQREILSTYSRSRQTLEATSFRVSIRYENELPVAFIYGQNNYLEDPSDAVILIREYLKRNAPIDHPIIFQVLGPSPFHADFYVWRGEEEDFQCIPMPGYDFQGFHTSQTVEEFQEITETEIAQELGLYYRLIQEASLYDTKWNQLTAKVQESIIYLRSKTGFINRMLELGRAPKINELALELAQYETEISNAVRRYSDELTRNSVEYSLERFRPKIEEEMKRLDFADAEHFGRIINVIGSHEKELGGYRLAMTAALVGVLAACLGGAVGALITIAMSA